MAPGDLVLTPGQRWPEHYNPGAEPMIWFDGLDIPLVRAVDALFFEPSPGQTIRHDVDSVSLSERSWRLGAGLVLR